MSQDGNVFWYVIGRSRVRRDFTFKDSGGMMSSSGMHSGYHYPTYYTPRNMGRQREETFERVGKGGGGGGGRSEVE